MKVLHSLFAGILFSSLATSASAAHFWICTVDDSFFYVADGETSFGQSSTNELYATSTIGNIEGWDATLEGEPVKVYGKVSWGVETNSYKSFLYSAGPGFGEFFVRWEGRDLDSGATYDPTDTPVACEFLSSN